MNDYPRKMFGGLSSNEVYKSLEKIYEILTFRVAIYKLPLFAKRFAIFKKRWYNVKDLKNDFGIPLVARLIKNATIEWEEKRWKF